MPILIWACVCGCCQIHSTQCVAECSSLPRTFSLCQISPYYSSPSTSHPLLHSLYSTNDSITKPRYTLTSLDTPSALSILLLNLSLYPISFSSSRLTPIAFSQISVQPLFVIKKREKTKRTWIQVLSPPSRAQPFSQSPRIANLFVSALPSSRVEQAFEWVLDSCVRFATAFHR